MKKKMKKLIRKVKRKVILSALGLATFGLGFVAFKNRKAIFRIVKGSKLLKKMKNRQPKKA